VAVFSVNIQTNTTPAITITMSGNTTYRQFKQSLGSIVYYINRVYLYSSNLPQIQGVFSYSKYDSDGNQNLQSIISAVSPYQTQSSIYLELEDKGLIIDGRDYVRFKMLPNTSLSLKVYCDKISVSQDYDEAGNNEFLKLEDLMQDYDFFDDYKDML
jgi:hypothetical protein